MAACLKSREAIEIRVALAMGMVAELDKPGKLRLTRAVRQEAGIGRHDRERRNSCCAFLLAMVVECLCLLSSAPLRINVRGNIKPRRSAMVAESLAAHMAATHGISTKFAQNGGIQDY
jgi:hypothetical protein